ncbi:Uncharacterised protein [Klebsiella pneumoniae]|nr:Uncharacterised protein [Klebsiella pneumoniae]
MDHPGHHGLRIAVDHVAVFLEEQKVLDAGIAFAPTALDHIDLMGLVGVEDRHAVDRRGLVGARRRIDDVVRPDHQRDVGIHEVGVDVFHVVDDVVGHTGLGEQHVHMPGHAARDRMDGELDVHAGRLKQLDEFV